MILKEKTLERMVKRFGLRHAKRNLFRLQNERVARLIPATMQEPKGKNEVVI